MSEDKERLPGESATEPATDSGEGFLTRWSRRKAVARRGGEPSPGPLVETADTPQPAPAGPDEATDGLTAESGEQADHEPGTAADVEVELPPIESLSEDSDYSAFLAPEVSADLQRQALRKLFHSPKFNVRDGLDDYDLDFSNPEPLGNIVTAEMRHRLLQELQRLAGLEEDVDAAEDVPTIAAGEGDEREGPPEQAAPDPGDERPETA